VIERHEGIEVDRCPQCRGGWLDESELSQVEATVQSTDEQRTGMIEYANHDSELTCPKCGGSMTAFNYRAYNLDEGEAKRVREIVEERVAGLERATKAEGDWNRFLGDLRKGPSFWDRLTGGR
jgi:hypothetical protein